MSRNLHQYYYKEYFGEKQEEIIDPNDSQNRRRINVSLNWMEIKSKENVHILQKRNTRLTEKGLLYYIEKPMDSIDTFPSPLEINYPGLVTGIGINHEATIEGEFKLGVHFDWTYGMPVVYGSSVKGVLKSYFKDFYTPKEGQQPTAEDAIEDIFNGGKKSIYNRDIFFDAVIIQPDKKGRILCSDSITPHGDSPLKNPVPITFLKIAPGCKLEFRFKLVPTEIVKDGKTLKISAQEKLDIFEEILTTVGIGAKTNVGYGQLKSV